MTQTKCCPIFAFGVVVVCLSNGSSRSHRALEGSSLPSCFFPFVFLLRRSTLALRLGDSGSWFSYAVADAGPASHRVRLWQGGPASSYCRFRLLVLLLTGTRLLRVRLLGHPDVRKRPWPLRRPMCSDSPLSSRPQPLGSVGDDTPCEDTMEDFGLFV